MTEWTNERTSQLTNEHMNFLPIFNFLSLGFDQRTRRRWEASVPCGQPWTWYDWRQVLWRGKREGILRENRGDRTEDKEDHGLASYTKCQVQCTGHSKLYLAWNVLNISVVSRSSIAKAIIQFRRHVTIIYNWNTQYWRHRIALFITIIRLNVVEKNTRCSRVEWIIILHAKATILQSKSTTL